MKLLAVIACPASATPTDRAAEALARAAADTGDDIVVATESSPGSARLGTEQVADADMIILAGDRALHDDMRFAHLPSIRTGLDEAINGTDALVARARAAGEERTRLAARTASAPPAEPEQAVTTAGIRGWLITGVSYVIPFVVAGGLLIALGYTLGGYQIAHAPPVADGFDWTARASWAALLFQLGGLTFAFLVPVLSGHIAHAIAGRTALAPGFVGGAVAVHTGAGFLGGLVAGLLAGAVIHLLSRRRPPRAVADAMPVLIMPLLGTLITGVIMWVVVGVPIAAVSTALTDWLGTLSGGSVVLLGAIVGLMMAFDLGGPVNKATYTFAVADLATGSPTALTTMAAVMAAGMTPPLAMALATGLRGRVFTPAERESGRAAWLLGAVFVTEGAIPFAAADPLRVMPSLMAGSAVTGALSVAAGATSAVPHGGVFVLGLIGHPLGYLAAILTGTMVSAALVIALKTFRRREPTYGTSQVATVAA